MKFQKLLLIIILFFVFGKGSFCQEIPISIRVETGFGYNIYDSKTKAYFDNSIYWSIGCKLFIGNVFLGFENNNPFSPIKDSLIIRNEKHFETERLVLDFSTIIVGFRLKEPKKNSSIDPYLGILKTYIQSSNRKNGYDSRIGIVGGVFITKNFETRYKRIQPFLYLNNRFNYNKLSEINSNLGKINYSVEIGIGLDFMR